MLDIQTRHAPSVRIAALRQSGLLNRAPKDEFGHLTDHVRDVLDVPVAIVTLVDEERQVFAGHSGLPEPWAGRGETPMTHSFCQHVVERCAPLVTNDARLDPTLRDNQAIGDIGVVAYLGVPLALPDGEVVGALAAIDSQPRLWTDADMRRLRSIARTVEKEMAVRISESRWRSLFEGLHEGFVVGRVVRDAHGRVVDWRYEEVNDAWHDLVGMPRGTAVGRTLRELIPGVEDEWVDEVARVVETGEPARFTRQAGPLNRWYDGVAQSIGGDRFTLLFMEVTDRIARERRREALQELGEVLFGASDGNAMLFAGSAVVGRALGMGRVGYGHVGADGETFTVPADWTSDGYPTLAGQYRMDDYGLYADDLRRGRTVVIPDIRLDRRTQADTGPLERVSVRTLVNHPIVENGRTVAVFFVNDDQPHNWTEEEVAFIQDAAARMRDAMERRRAETALVASDERRRLALIVGEVGVWELDTVGGVLTLDERMRGLNGVFSGELDAAGAFAAVHPDDRSRLEEALRALAAGEISALSIQYRVIGIEDGKVRTVQVNGVAAPHALAVAPLLFGAARDITERVEVEEGQRVLNQELAHRMKNSMAMVQAIATQTLRQAKTMDEARDALSSRLSALARAQDILTRTNFDGADVREVAQTAMAPHRVAGERVAMAGPRGDLSAQQALGLSLAIHELATNAAKYGALSNETGRVDVTWVVADDTFTFRWIESGGPPVTPPEQRGFGSKLIERIVASYFDGEGHIDFAPDGIRFTLTGAFSQPAGIVKA